MLKRFISRQATPEGLLDKAAAQAEQGRRLAMYDRLTGLFAAWYVRQRFDEEAKRASRGERQMSVIAIRAPRADGLGPHDALVLWLRQKVRPYDMPCHFGEDLFVMIMPDTVPKDAEKVAKRLRKEVEGARTAVSVYPDDALTFDELEQLAGSRLAA